VSLADQIQDVPDSRVKFSAELRKHLPQIEAQAVVWQGLVDRLHAERGEADLKR